MKVACIQPHIYTSLKKCYHEVKNQIFNLLEECNSLDLICLPERWTPLSNTISENIQIERGKNYLFIKDIAKEYCLNIISGAIWEKRKKLNKPYITSYFIDEKGEEIGRQDKIHLYTYEREYFESGKVINLFKINNRFFSILICFDMAFFETPRLAAENGADFLLSPTQIREEGMQNWDIYLKARALENRIPVIACNSVGKIYKRNFIGNSKIISFFENFMTPSKLKIIEGPKSAGFIYGEIDLDFPKKLRQIRLKEKINKEDIKVKIVN